jgi:cysteine-rich repeat protein
LYVDGLVAASTAMSSFVRCCHAALLCAMLWSVACSVDQRTLHVSANASRAGDDAGAPSDNGSGGALSEGGAPINHGGSGNAPPSEGGAPSAAPACGDGVVDEGEACDDGARADRDGCNSACELEPGYECSGEPSACRSCSGASDERRCLIAGGPFELDAEAERIPAAVSAFQLDELEVTVGRFRRYVEHFDGPPGGGSGEHAEVPDSGWRNEWNETFPADRSQLLATLRCNADWETWTNEPGDREEYPLTCVSYYVAFAFCAAQGGRLPTEAEWEYAAAGGAQQRAYPWGDDEPSTELAVFETRSIEPAGARAAGRARFGQLDLAGSVWEWTLDYFAPYTGNCDRCAVVQNGNDRVLRGGSFLEEAQYLSASYRFAYDPQLSLGNVGFRCAYPLEE